jgi:hypothetical protein
MIDLLKRIEGMRFGSDAEDELVLDVPSVPKIQSNEGLRSDYETKLVDMRSRLHVRRAVGAILLPTIIGAMIVFDSGTHRDLIRGIDELTSAKKSFKEDMDAGALPIRFLGSNSIEIPQSFLQSAVKLENPNYNFSYFVLRDLKTSFVKPRDISEFLKYQNKIVFTRGKIAEATEQKNMFIIDGGENGRVFAYVAGPVQSPAYKPVITSRLYKETVGGNKSNVEEVELSELTSFIDATRLSGQEVVVGGIAKEGRLEADMFSFNGKRRFAYLLRPAN